MSPWGAEAQIGLIIPRLYQTAERSPWIEDSGPVQRNSAPPCEIPGPGLSPAKHEVTAAGLVARPCLIPNLRTAGPFAASALARSAFATCCLVVSAGFEARGGEDQRIEDWGFPKARLAPNQWLRGGFPRV